MIMQIFNHSDSFCKWEWDERRAQNGWGSSSTSAKGSEIWAATKVIESFFHSSFLLCCLWQMFKKCVVSWRHAVMEFGGRREIIWSFVCLLNHGSCVVVICNRNLLISFGFDCDLIALPRIFHASRSHHKVILVLHRKALCQVLNLTNIVSLLFRKLQQRIRSRCDVITSHTHTAKRWKVRRRK